MVGKTQCAGTVLALAGGLESAWRAAGVVWGVGCCRRKWRRCGGGLVVACCFEEMLAMSSRRLGLGRKSIRVAVRGWEGSSLMVGRLVLWGRVVVAVVVGIAGEGTLICWNRRTTFCEE